MASTEPPADQTGSLTELESSIGHHFRDPDLLLTALTHSSFVAEHTDVESYERLELLGDAVLGLFVTELILGAMPDQPEGVMTKVRATVVNEPSLAAVARQLGLGRFIRLGVGESRSGGADRDSLLSDVVEAILGAVFLDAGSEVAARVVGKLFADTVSSAVGQPDATDSRSRLQELLAKTNRVASFTFERSGPDHAVVFNAVVSAGDQELGRGAGSSKKAAAIAASADALARNTHV